MSLPEIRKKVLREFQCQGSGNCCRAGGYVYVTAQELAAMAELLGKTVAALKSEVVVHENGWMLISTPTHRPKCFLDSENRCSVYRARPKACRTYPDWDLIWASQESFEQECRSCPGLHKAWGKIKNKSASLLSELDAPQ